MINHKKSCSPKPIAAFTLVELIVVIIILAILATIAFLSFSSQSGLVRDSTRLTDISSIKKGVEMYNVNSGLYPTPDNPVSITYSGGVVWNQGILGDNSYRLISKTLSKKVKDPLNDTEYDYSLASNKREYQLAANFENPTTFEKNLNPFESISKSFALGGTGANVYISGNYNGVALKVQSDSTFYILPVPTLFGIVPVGSTSIPYDNSFSSGKMILPGVNQIATYTPSSIYSTDLSNLSDSDVSIMMNAIKSAYSGSNINTSQVQQIVSTSGQSLTDLGKSLIKNSLGVNVITKNTPVVVLTGSTSSKPGLSCKDIKIQIPSSSDGTFWIKPDTNPAYQVYCNMNTDGGGWTLVASIIGSGPFPAMNSNFSDTYSYGTYDATGYGSGNYYKPYNTISYTDFLFMTGDKVTWCEVNPTGLRVQDGTQIPNITVINSYGTTISAGGLTNNLFRSANPEDPWFGCEGSHASNTNKMLWGEYGVDLSPHQDYKNAHSGIGLFIR